MAFIQAERVAAQKKIKNATQEFVRLKNGLKAEPYLELYFSDPIEYADIFLGLKKYLGTLAGKRILEIGCGLGLFLLALKREGVDAHGIEIVGAVSKAAQSIGINAKIGDACALHKLFQTEQFDAVISKAFLEEDVLEPYGDEGYEEKLSAILNGCNFVTKLGGINIHQAMLLDIQNIDLSKFGFELIEFYETDWDRIAILKKARHARMLDVPQGHDTVNS